MKGPKGTLFLMWMHVSPCPALVIDDSDPRFPDLPSYCVCGMPTFTELEVLCRSAERIWGKRVERGERSYIEPPPGPPNEQVRKDGRTRLKLVTREGGEDGRERT